MDHGSQLGILLQRARRARGLSQSEAALQVGLKTGQAISDLERGRAASFPPERLLQLIRIYKIEPETVMKLYIEREKKRLESRLRQKLKLD